MLSSVTSGASSRRVFAASVRSRRMRSIARLRAVEISQLDGLPGTPSRGQRSAAIAKASCAASSARSKSPRRPMRVASTRPHESRKTCSSSNELVLHDGADLDRAAEAGGRDPRGELDRGVEVVRLVDQVAADGLLELD